MAECWVHPETGNDANPGTEAQPWKLIPGQTGANAVAAGDTINVRTGTISTGGRMVLTQDNLTYRGYGLADNVLTLTLPKARDPTSMFTLRVVRQSGVHEGLWTVDGTGQTLQGILNYGTRAGCVVEDLGIINARETSTAVSIGASSQAQIGATLRRASIIGANAGIANYRPNTLLEYVLVQDVDDDGITIGTGATQSFHAGNWNTLRYLNLIDCGIDTGSGIGDPIQLLSSAGYQGTLTVKQSLIRRNAQVKQGFMMAAVKGSVIIDGNYWDGQDVGSIQIGIESVQAGGLVLVRRNYWTQNTSNGNHYVRLVDGANDFEDGGQIVIENNIVDVANHAGLFSFGHFLQTLSGQVIVRGNTVFGVADNGLSFSATIGARTSGTITATCSMLIENNTLIGASPVAIRLPEGDENDSRWTVRNNSIYGAATVGYFGAQGFGDSYDSVAAFQAAHSAATNNTEADPLITEAGRPLPNSPLLTGGTSTIRRDINGVQGRNFIGAYAAAALRTR